MTILYLIVDSVKMQITSITEIETDAMREAKNINGLVIPISNVWDFREPKRGETYTPVDYGTNESIKGQ